jgi:hypothetical protein
MSGSRPNGDDFYARFEPVGRRCSQPDWFPVTGCSVEGRSGSEVGLKILYRAA